MNEHDILEAAELVMILPKQYYSNYDKWIRVGWALRILVISCGLHGYYLVHNGKISVWTVLVQN